MLRDYVVIGAGVSGLSCASELIKNRRQVIVMEKSRGVGGRTATKRIDAIGHFDIGAQFFTARSDEMRQAINELHSIEEWTADIRFIKRGLLQAATEERRFVGKPQMNSWLKDLFDEKLVITAKKLVKAEYQETWRLTFDDDDQVNCHHLVLSIPPEQAFELLKKFEHLSFLRQIEMTPCWAVMVAFKERPKLAYNAAFVRDHQISWFAENDSKPDRPQWAASCWTIHASAQWSQQYLEQQPDFICDELIAAFCELTKCKEEVVFKKAHRWRYAQSPFSREQHFYWDDQINLGLCGDWFHGGRVEGAFLSGYHLAKHMLSV